MQQQFILPSQSKGMRLDVALGVVLPGYSRSCLKKWIDDGRVLVAGKVLAPKFKISGLEVVVINVPEANVTQCLPSNIALDVIYSDPELIVINKPANLVVHPAAGHYQDTLVNALLYHYPELQTLPRAGIIHRLDKDTTGLLVVARNLPAHNALVQQLQRHEIERYYLALVKGELIGSSSISGSIGRNRKHRQKMAVLEHGGKEALTYYAIIKRYPGVTLLKVKLATGRTHQIRVHCAHIGHPVIGDQLYGRKLGRHQVWSDQLFKILQEQPRQALHAVELSLIHPKLHERITWQAPNPQDLDILINALEQKT